MSEQGSYGEGMARDGRAMDWCRPRTVHAHHAGRRFIDLDSVTQPPEGRRILNY